MCTPLCRLRRQRPSMSPDQTAASGNSALFVWHAPCDSRVHQAGTGLDLLASNRGDTMLDMKRTVAARPRACRWLSAAAGLAFSFAATYQATAEDTIKIGILHSLSGTMAISETTLKDTMLFLIDEQ